MTWHRVGRHLCSGLVCVLLILVFLSEWLVSGTAPGWLRMVAGEIQAACRDTGSQGMVVVCLASYFGTFLFLERQQWNSTPHPGPLPVRGGEGGGAVDAKTAPPASGFWASSSFSAFCRGKIANPDCWLIGLVGLVLLRYVFAYETAARSLQPLVLLAGVVFGKGVALWARGRGARVVGRKPEEVGRVTPCAPGLVEDNRPPSGAHGVTRPTVTLSILVLLLAASALWQPEYGMEFQYRGQRRWTGAWDNPNLYGLLMGVGVILAVGLLVSSRKSKGQGLGNAKARHLTPALPMNRVPADVSPLHLNPAESRSRLTPAATVQGFKARNWSRRILSPFEVERESSAPAAWRWVKVVSLLTAAGICGVGLVKSYSRGAWLGTAVGLGWLLWQWISRTHLTPARSPGPPGGEGESFPRLASRPTPHALRNFWLLIAVLLASVLVLSFWQFRHTENPLVRRVFSVGNPNDFSWRNRVSTWAGAVTMMKDRPWVGHGWGKAEAVFGEQYKPVHLQDTAAIQMNDYLMLGISGGVPALLCFVAYILVSGRRAWETSRATAGLLTSDLSRQPSVVAAAGATVLLVGFWFDGGLFKLATGAVFWGLMELSWGRSRGNEAPANEGGARPSVRAVGGEIVFASQPVGSLASPAGDTSSGCCRVDSLPPARSALWAFARQTPFAVSRTAQVSPSDAEKGGGAHGVPRPTLALRWLAGILAALAIAQTALHLGTPQLAVRERTLNMARKFIVPPSEKADFEFLAAKKIWAGIPLKTLLQHAHLANYNRSLVNWKLADDVYHRFVLSPPIAAALDGDMNWRRPLWESFYPRIRKESSLAAAAEIVSRHLRERVRLVATPDAPETITALWQRGHASARGFEIIYVAALRSAGIPARLNQQGQAEFWDGSEWKATPRPMDGSTSNY